MPLPNNSTIHEDHKSKMATKTKSNANSGSEQKHQTKSVVTPVGGAGWLNLNKEDPKYGGYKAEVRLSGEDAAGFVAMVDRMAEEVFGAKLAVRGNLPYTEDDETGEVLVRAKSKYKITAFDAKGNKINLKKVKVGSGSKVRLAVKLQTYKHSSKVYGVKAYPEGIQIIKLVEFSGGAGSGAEMFKSSEADLEDYLDEGEEAFVYDGPEDDGEDEDEDETPFNNDEDNDDADF